MKQNNIFKRTLSLVLFATVVLSSMNILPITTAKADETQSVDISKAISQEELVLGKQYYVKNAHTGKYLTMSYANPDVTATQENFTGGVTQKFRIYEDEINGNYIVKTCDKIFPDEELGSRGSATSNIVRSNSSYDNSVEITWGANNKCKVSKNVSGYIYYMSATSMEGTQVHSTTSVSSYGDWILEPAVAGHIVNGDQYYIKNVATGKYVTIDQYGHASVENFDNSIGQKFTVSYDDETDSYTIITADSSRNYRELGTNNFSSQIISLSSPSYDNKIELGYDVTTGYYKMERNYNSNHYEIIPYSFSADNEAVIITTGYRDNNQWIFQPAVDDEEEYKVRAFFSSYIYLNIQGSAWDIRMGTSALNNHLFSLDYNETLNKFEFSHKDYDYSPYIENVTLAYEPVYNFYRIIKNDQYLSLKAVGNDDGTVSTQYVSASAAQPFLCSWVLQKHMTNTAIAMDNINCYSNKNGTEYNYYPEGKTWHSSSKYIEKYFNVNNYYTDSVYIKLEDGLDAVLGKRYLVIDNATNNFAISSVPEKLYTQRKTDNGYNIIDDDGNVISCTINFTTGGYTIALADSGEFVSIINQQLSYNTNAGSKFIFTLTTENGDKTAKEMIFEALETSDVVTIASHGEKEYLYLQDISSRYSYTVDGRLTSLDFNNSSLDFSNCELLILFSCNGGNGTEATDDLDCIAEQFYNKGVKTVVCFKASLTEAPSNEWAKFFYKALGEGRTVEDALEKANEYYINDADSDAERQARQASNNVTSQRIIGDRYYTLSK